MSLLIGSDLDRTLIYSRAAFDLTPGAPQPPVVCVELSDGAPMSFVTATAHDLLTTLADSGTLVPVTSRTVAQYQRITLPGKDSAFAICANGGRLLVDGVEDWDYRAALEADLNDACAPLGQVWDVLRAASDERARVGKPLKTIRQADELFCYAVEWAEADPVWVGRLDAAVAPLGWGVTQQLRKVYLVPNLLTKVRALREVAERTGAARVLAAGDAHLDVSILRYADEAIRPAHGELHQEGWHPPNLTVTSASGIAAGEEIAVWMLERLACNPT